MASSDFEWDQALRARAKEEDFPLPEGFVSFLSGRLEHLPPKESVRRSRRRLILLAAAAALLTACAGAAVVTLGQNRIFYFETAQQAAQAANEAAAAAGASTAAYGTFSGLGEYPEPEEVDLETGMSYYQGEDEQVLEHAFGTPEDGWTEMFTAQTDSLIVSQYKADRLSDLAGFWPMDPPDLSALEEDYQPLPGCQSHYQQAARESGKLRYLGFYGSFLGQGEAQFSLDWTFHPVGRAGNTYMAGDGLDRIEDYETADGAEVTILWDTAPSGKVVFEASVSYGYVSFSMRGTQMESGTVHTILDSLSLSHLANYQPD